MNIHEPRCIAIYGASQARIQFCATLIIFRKDRGSISLTIRNKYSNFEPLISVLGRGNVHRAWQQKLLNGNFVLLSMVA